MQQSPFYTNTPDDYADEIIRYYNTTESSYIDGWDLNNSMAMHYGYKDATTKSFGDTLLRMNQVLAQMAHIQPTDKVLDAGCGIGGSSIWLSRHIGCSCTGITLSSKQAEKGNELAKKFGLENKVSLHTMNYESTNFPNESFDVIWGLESICYASSKEKFIQEAFRLLKPGGRLIIADGMVTDFKNNQHPIIKNWLKGWRVNFLESPERFKNFFTAAGFTQFIYEDITANALSSSKRLYWIYYGSKLWGWWKKITNSYTWTRLQEENIDACYYQYVGMKKKLWGYGIVCGTKPKS